MRQFISSGKLSLVLILLLSISCFYSSCNQNSEQQQIDNNHKLSPIIDGFHIYSYYAGSAFTAAEFVGAGCKKLAISPTYNPRELKIMLEPTKMAALEYDLPIYVEDEFLTTKLFDPDLTANKTVIFIAQNQNVLDQYFALKDLKKKAIADGRLAELEEKIAWEFGRLLSYSDDKIKKLLN